MSRTALAILIAFVFCGWANGQEPKDVPATPTVPATSPPAATDPTGTQESKPATETSPATETVDESKAAAAADAEPVALRTELFAGESLQLQLPEFWKTVPPASGMIELEISVPGATEEDTAGRMTGMGAGGTLEANINRWYSQFIQPDGSDTSEKSTVEVLEVGEQKIHFVDLAGTFLDGMGPNAPKTERADYRMLAAIVELDEDTNYFLKLYGPAALIEAQVPHFRAMLESIQPVK